MSDDTITDVSSFDFEAWVKFVFDHPFIELPDEKWYWDLNRCFIVTNPRQLLEHFTRLCRDFPEIAARYSLPQIDQGIWFLLSEPVRCGTYLADASIATGIKETCVRSMLNVYSGFVAKSNVEVMENCFDMWWDLICGGFWLALAGNPLSAVPEKNYENLNEDQKAVLNVMLETLTKILELKEERCIGYALHGLGHLHHPNVKIVIQKFIDQNREEIPEESLAWVESCRDGTVM